MRSWTLDLGYPAPPMRENDRLHWRARAAKTKDVRERVGWLAKTKLPRKQIERCEIHLIWSVTDRRRRDSAAANPTLKAAIDGLVDAGILADDNYRIVKRSWCEIELAPEAGVALVIEELEEEKRVA